MANQPDQPDGHSWVEVLRLLRSPKEVDFETGYEVFARRCTPRLADLVQQAACRVPWAFDYRGRPRLSNELLRGSTLFLRQIAPLQIAEQGIEDWTWEGVEGWVLVRAAHLFPELLQSTPARREVVASPPVMLPPEHDAWEVSVLLQQIGGQGGDWIDYDIGSDGILWMIVGDVSGHGPIASPFAAATPGLVAQRVAGRATCRQRHSPRSAITNARGTPAGM